MIVGMSHLVVYDDTLACLFAACELKLPEHEVSIRPIVL